MSLKIWMHWGKYRKAQILSFSLEKDVTNIEKDGNESAFAIS